MKATHMRFLGLYSSILLVMFLTGCAGMRSQPRLVAILTDYGQTDFYAGVLEGVIYKTAPQVRISTITHDVEPFNVAEGSYLLEQAVKAYPPGTVFLCIVDPGVGTRRRSIILETSNRQFFVGPDNGLFNGVLKESEPVAAYEIEASTNRSSTFHGRDVFGPTAARLASGISAKELGHPIELSTLIRLDLPEPVVDGNVMTGTILHVDRYGNMISNISASLAERAGLRIGRQVPIRINGQTISARVVTTYGDVPEGEWVILKNAEGSVEIARNMANAAQTVQARAGASLVIGP
jgi:S-adenosylmethionine hydrolase